MFPAGDYRAVNDEKLTGRISFPLYRRVSIMNLRTGVNQGASSIDDADH